MENNKIILASNGEKISEDASKWRKEWRNQIEEC